MPRGDRGGSSRGSGTRCVAANCGNTNADGFSLHSFPKDPNLRRKWTGFVKLKRANWDGPTEFSALCSVHFIIDDFPFRHRFEIEHMGRAPKKAKLNVGAVPTVHSPSIAKQVSMVKEKPLETEQPIPTTPKHTLPRLEMLSPSETSTCQSSPPKKIRRGYIKREAARLVADHYQNISTVSEPAEEDKQETSVSEPAEDIDQPDNHVMDFEEVVEYEVDDPKPTTASFSCQVNKRPKKRSKYCQTNSKTTKYQKPAVKMRTIGTQTDGTNEIQPPKPLMSDAFQLVRPDNLKPLTMPRKSKEHARSSTTTIDEPFSSPMKDDQESDPSYQPLSPSSDDNDEQEMRNIHVPVEEDSKFIVFQSHLMELFTTCTKCMADTVGEIMYTRGSMVKIKQECKICLYVRFWFSQPFVGNKPAGNLSISAGILFSGSVPSKALRMLKFMNICGISMSSYMNHQKFYLYPAIGHVWHNYQNDYANDIQQQQRSVTLGGDGRADTPGHSAKFGSYTMLDLDEGVVVDIQLVQDRI
ncbi:uncharacterized protein LOC143059203 [Mytilus galloprovincialis]|uniref:uncharacterized protein LOC143059203 n=1 Tax=Mytilus galloprovincialis TaxID=29158 RepID=UPI003F7C5F5F